MPLSEAAEDGVANARGSVNFINGSLKMGRRCGCGRHLEGVFVVDPPGVDGGHEDGVVLGEGPRAGPRHHVQGRFGHVGVRVVRRLVPVKFACKKPPTLRMRNKSKFASQN